MPHGKRVTNASPGRLVGQGLLNKWTTGTSALLQDWGQAEAWGGNLVSTENDSWVLEQKHLGDYVLVLLFRSRVNHKNYSYPLFLLISSQRNWLSLRDEALCKWPSTQQKGQKIRERNPFSTCTNSKPANSGTISFKNKKQHLSWWWYVMKERSSKDKRIYKKLKRGQEN